LHAFAAEAMALDFPFVRSIVVVRSETTNKKTGEVSHDTRYFASSTEPGERTPAQWQALVRGHWGGVEIRNHWRRDALWGEDDSRTRNAPALANLALLRNALLALLPENFGDKPLKEIQEDITPAGCLRLIRSK
jgi:predicted transposase YbfD/YdcC